MTLLFFFIQAPDFMSFRSHCSELQRIRRFQIMALDFPELLIRPSAWSLKSESGYPFRLSSWLDKRLTETGKLPLMHRYNEGLQSDVVEILPGL